MIINSPNSSEDMKAISEKAQQPVTERVISPPPPYSSSGSAGPSHAALPASGPTVVPSRQSGQPGSILQPMTIQTVNHFELFSRHDAIAGTFVVDPSLPSPIALSKNLRKKPDSVWGKPKGKRSKHHHEVNALFQTRHGRINLNLSVSLKDAQSQANPTPGDRLATRVYVASQHGRINVEVHEVHSSRTLDLHVESRHGRINLLLPPTFDGPLIVQARSLGSVQILPYLAARARTISGKDSQTILLVSSPLSPQSFSAVPEAKHLGELAGASSDKCLVRTRHGKITIGISGLDKIEEAPENGSLFMKMGHFLEAQGRALGQFLESQARVVEKKTQVWAGNGTPQYDNKDVEIPGSFPYERYERASQPAIVGSVSGTR